MKKTYLNPELEIVKIQTVGMLALSAGGSTGNESDLLAPGTDFDFDITEEVFSIDEDKFDFGTSESISNFE